MPSNHHVVPDLHEIINFRALADHRVAQGAPVDGGIGADFDIVLDDHSADLRHFQMARLAHGEAEAVLADGRAGMDSDMVTDQGVGYRGIRADIAVPPDMHAVTDDAAGRNCRPLPDACLGSDHRPRLDDRAWLESGGRVHR